MRKRESNEGMSRKGDDKGCTFAQWSCAVMDSYPLPKLKAPGLSARKWMKLLMMVLHSLVERSYKLHSIMMCS